MILFRASSGTQRVQYGLRAGRPQIRHGHGLRAYWVSYWTRILSQLDRWVFALQTTADLVYDAFLSLSQISSRIPRFYTGNRVTCRDWFQLTLKEGLTVYRDQEFSGDMMQSHAVKRIEDVRGLRASQFREDAGPLSKWTMEFLVIEN